MSTVPIRATVVSQTLGRLRIRLDPQFRQVATFRQIEDGVTSQPGVIEVETNQSSGSVVVRYLPDRLDSDAILGALRGAGLDFAPGKRPRPGGQIAAHSTASLGVIGFFQTLDRNVLHATEGKVNLKFLFPIALLAIGVRQTMTRGLGLDQVPGYIILWYALDAFWKFHQEEKVMARQSLVESVLAIEPDPDPLSPEGPLG